MPNLSMAPHLTHTRHLHRGPPPCRPSNKLSPTRPRRASLQNSYTPWATNTTTISKTHAPPPVLAIAQAIAARHLLLILLLLPNHFRAHPQPSSHPSGGTRLRVPRPQSQLRPGSVPIAHTSSATAVHPTSSDTSRRIRGARMSRTGSAVECP